MNHLVTNLSPERRSKGKVRNSQTWLVPTLAMSLQVPASKMEARGAGALTFPKAPVGSARSRT